MRALLSVPSCISQRKVYAGIFCIIEGLSCTSMGGHVPRLLGEGLRGLVLVCCNSLQSSRLSLLIARDCLSSLPMQELCRCCSFSLDGG